MFRPRRPSPEAVARYGTHVLTEPLQGCVVVSFPKSGRTWLRVLLDRLDVPLAYTHDGSGHQQRLELSELSLEKTDFRDHRVILLIRDPRDVVVSGYFMATHRRKLFRGTLSQFLRDKRHGLRKTLHFNQTWYAARQDVADFLLVRYERMHEDPEAVVRRILDFVGRRVKDSSIRQAVDFCRFENMQRLERAGHFASRYGVLLSGKADDPEALKTRRGKVGGFVDYLNAADLEYCNQALRDSSYPLMSPLPDEA